VEESNQASIANMETKPSETPLPQTPIPPSEPQLPVVGYCRMCGKALNETTVRQAQGSIYCAEHVPAAFTNSFPPESKPRTGFAEPRYGESPYSSSVPPVRPQSDANPVAAFWLGLIPGVGAIYNGQYAKGLAHVVVFGLLISLADLNGPFEALFGIMIPVFVLYMAFEAHHTAKHRRDGMPIDEFSSIVAGPQTRFPLIPILLIVGGVIFLLDSLEILQLEKLLRFWPILMIALGAYMLYARTLAWRNDDRSPRNPNDPTPGFVPTAKPRSAFKEDGTRDNGETR
jgi:hypothetical protein